MCWFVSMIVDHMNRTRIALVVFPIIYALTFLIFQIPNLIRKGDGRFMVLSIACLAIYVVIGMTIIIHWPNGI